MSDPTGYRESPDTADGPTGAGPTGENMVDGTPGEDRADTGESDTTLTTDDDAQRADQVERPGNAPD
jgi:hypothetical protein